jgi:hypothetical protein
VEGSETYGLRRHAIDFVSSRASANVTSIIPCNIKKEKRKNRSYFAYSFSFTLICADFRLGIYPELASA